MVREDANVDGAEFGFEARSEMECLKQCIRKYPDCSAVDYNYDSGACAGHRANTGLGHYQKNSCCVRFEIIQCLPDQPGRYFPGTCNGVRPKSTRTINPNRPQKRADYNKSSPKSSSMSRVATAHTENGLVCCPNPRTTPNDNSIN